MAKNKFGNSVEESFEPPRYNYYGLSHAEWYALTPEQRVLHYNRKNICEHKADLLAWPELLRESYSFDPYAHLAHMIPHDSLNAECSCQMCEGQIGILRADAEH